MIRMLAGFLFISISVYDIAMGTAVGIGVNYHSNRIITMEDNPIEFWLIQATLLSIGIGYFYDHFNEK